MWTRLGNSRVKGGGGEKKKKREETEEGKGGGEEREGIDVVKEELWDVFKDYVDLYVELMRRVRSDLDTTTTKDEEEEEEEKETSPSSSPETTAAPTVTATGAADAALEGQRSYLAYRRANDPARPMLRRLYGEDWAEELISNVLFPDV